MSKKFDSQFSMKLEKLREETGMDKGSFAKYLGYTPQTIYNYSGGRMPSMEFIFKLIDKFPDLDLNWLLKDNYELSEPQYTKVEDGGSDYLRNEAKDYIKMLDMTMNKLRKLIGE